MMASNQLAEALKKEIVVDLYGPDNPGCAVVSSNLHQDHFGANFGIRLADGSPAHSSCVGFGLERISLALLRQHGFDPEAWPAAVRMELWP